MSESLSELLVRLRPVIESVLAAHRVPPEEAETLLGELMQTLCFKRDTIADPAAWLLAALVRALEQRGSQEASGDSELPTNPPSGAQP